MLLPILPRVDGRQALAERLGAPFELLLAGLAFDPLADDVILSGSLVEGLGNVDSDIDVFVVGDQVRHRRGGLWFWHDARRWVDVTYCEAAAIDQLAARIRGSFVEITDWSAHPCAAFGDVDLYHRLCIGVATTDPVRPAFQREQFDVRKLGREIAYQNIVVARARWLDAVGAFRDGQHLQAAYVARICFDFAVDAYSALLGETNPNPKWRWARIARLEAAGREPLQLMRSMFPVRMETDRETAEHALGDAAGLLFNVQHLFLRGTLVEPARPPLPGERFEVTSKAVLRVTIDGTAHAASASFAPSGRLLESEPACV